MPGRKYRSIKRPKVYEALRRKGMTKSRAARISNAKRQPVAPDASRSRPSGKSAGISSFDRRTVVTVERLGSCLRVCSGREVRTVGGLVGLPGPPGNKRPG
jgi:hypothetical protein